MRTLEEIRAVMSRHSLIKSVDVVRRGHIRIETGFKYPDGTSIEVFLVRDRNAPLFGISRVSDLGQTMEYLFNMGVRPWQSAKRRMFLEDALRTNEVKQDGGMLYVPIANDEEVPEAIMRLGQACLRASDLVFTRRVSLQSTFAEQLEEALSEVELRYDSSPELQVGGDVIRVDFLVHGRRTESAVLTVSSTNAGQAHSLTNEVFRKFYDLRKGRRPEQRLTIFDDSVDVYRAADLKRLEDVSQVVPFSEREAWTELLAA